MKDEEMFAENEALKGENDRLKMVQDQLLEELDEMKGQVRENLDTLASLEGTQEVIHQEIQEGNKLILKRLEDIYAVLKNKSASDGA